VCNTCIQVRIDRIRWRQRVDQADRRYRINNQREFVAPRLSHILGLPRHQQEILCQPSISHVENIKRVATAINENSKLSFAIAEHGTTLLSCLVADDEDDRGPGDADGDAIVRSTLRQLYRDYSEEGSRERDLCHKTLMQDLVHVFAGEPFEKRRRILVPGAGLLRLPLNLQLAGYEVEANEVSHHQILASLFILNQAEPDPQHTLYPWALSFSNHVFRDDQFAAVSVPDLRPKNQIDKCAGVSPPLMINMNDFVIEYSKRCYKNAFDAVTTLFFIDTAPNLLDYIATVNHCLDAGGVWINVGPLLWNCYENGPAGRQEGDLDDDISCKMRHHLALDTSIGPGPQKLEFSNDEVLKLLEHYGFVVEVQDGCIGEAGFVANPRSMLQNMYQLSHWVARKKP
jgi:carnosine N-methyltransferase